MVIALVGVVIFGVLRLWASAEILAEIRAPYSLFIIRTIGVLLAVSIALVADRLIRHFFWDGYLRRRRKSNTPALIEDIVTIALIVLGVSVGLFFEAGVSFTGVLTASGATAIVLGIALQAVIQDLFSGLSINMDGSYAIDDWLTIYLEDFDEVFYGRVAGITWRTTYLRQTNGNRLIIPNRMMTANPVINHSRPPGPKRLMFELEVDVRFPSDRVESIILGETYRVLRQKGLYASPEPSVLVVKLGNDSATYQVRFYADPGEIEPEDARSVVTARVHQAMLRLNVPNPVTQIELTPPPDTFAFTEKEEREALAKVPLFNVLTPEQIDALNTACSSKFLAADTIFIRQGEQAASMFILLEGAARVTIASPTADEQVVAVLASGDIVGEMSLMTGAPRTATVTAITPLRVLEITQGAIADLLRLSPELLNRFGHVLASRQLELTEIAARAEKKDEVERDLLNRMRTFFAGIFGG